MNTIINSVNLDLKTLVSSLKKTWYIIFIPTMALITNVVVFPISETGGWTFFIATSVPSILIYSIIKNSYRRSTLRQNEDLTDRKFILVNIEGILFLFIIIALFTFITFINYFFIGNVFNAFINGWLGSDDYGQYNFNAFDLTFINLLTILMYYTLLDYSFCILLSLIFKTEKEIFLSICVMVILSIVFSLLICGTTHWLNFSEIYLDKPNELGEYTVITTWNSKTYSAQKWQSLLNIISVFIFPWNFINQIFNLNIVLDMVNITQPISEVHNGIEYAYRILEIPDAPFLFDPILSISIPDNHLMEVRQKIILLFMVFVPLVHSGLYVSLAFVLRNKAQKK